MWTLKLFNNGYLIAEITVNNDFAARNIVRILSKHYDKIIAFSEQSYLYTTTKDCFNYEPEELERNLLTYTYCSGFDNE